MRLDTNCGERLGTDNSSFNNVEPAGIRESSDEFHVGREQRRTPWIPCNVERYFLFPFPQRCSHYIKLPGKRRSDGRTLICIDRRNMETIGNSCPTRM